MVPYMLGKGVLVACARTNTGQLSRRQSFLAGSDVADDRTGDSVDDAASGRIEQPKDRQTAGVDDAFGALHGLKEEVREIAVDLYGASPMLVHSRRRR